MRSRNDITFLRHGEFSLSAISKNPSWGSSFFFFLSGDFAFICVVYSSIPWSISSFLRFSRLLASKLSIVSLTSLMSLSKPTLSAALWTSLSSIFCSSSCMFLNMTKFYSSKSSMNTLSSSSVNGISQSSYVSFAIFDFSNVSLCLFYVMNVSSDSYCY